eukprot:11976325-Ditylum_brightwellii.AAC.1
MGVAPIPPDADGCHSINRWEFHYQGWEYPSEEKAMYFTTLRNLFPDSRRGKLCYNTLSWLFLHGSRKNETEGYTMVSSVVIEYV